METKRIFNLIILDASGSMSSIYQQALTGVNETIQTILMAQQPTPNCSSTSHSSHSMLGKTSSTASMTLCLLKM